MDQEFFRKLLHFQKYQKIISAQQCLMRNTMIPDIDYKYQINIAKLSTSKSSTVYNYSLNRNSKIIDTIKCHLNQIAQKTKRRQIKPIRFKTQQSTKTEMSAERSYNIAQQQKNNENNFCYWQIIELIIEFLQEKFGAKIENQEKCVVL